MEKKEARRFSSVLDVSNEEEVGCLYINIRRCKRLGTQERVPSLPYIYVFLQADRLALRTEIYLQMSDKFFAKRGLVKLADDVPAGKRRGLIKHADDEPLAGARRGRPQRAAGIVGPAPSSA